MHPIETIEDFYAHGLAIEREAMERYAEFATHFADRGEDVLSSLCTNLARFEGEHYQDLVRAALGLTLPIIEAGRYRWLEEGSPEAPARELFYRIVKPRQLLEIALDAEVRAREFFVWVAKTSQSIAVRELAAIMAAEETEHIHWVTQALEYQSGPVD
jgi:bacterioferritin (cytochrome b1)